MVTTNTLLKAIAPAANTCTRYPSAAAGAMRVNGTLYYVLGDQLGSASVVMDASGTVVGETRYYPFGETRSQTGSMFTDRLFTGQQQMASLGLYNYGARFYSPTLGRFIQPDTIIPSMDDPQSLNRYSYVNNNPINYIDPTGHMRVENNGGGGAKVTIKKNTTPTNYVAEKKIAKAEERATRTTIPPSPNIPGESSSPSLIDVIKDKIQNPDVGTINQEKTPSLNILNTIELGMITTNSLSTTYNGYFTLWDNGSARVSINNASMSFSPTSINYRLSTPSLINGEDGSTHQYSYALDIDFSGGANTANVSIMGLSTTTNTNNGIQARNSTGFYSSTNLLRGTGAGLVIGFAAPYVIAIFGTAAAISPVLRGATVGAH